MSGRQGEASSAVVIVGCVKASYGKVWFCSSGWEGFVAFGRGQVRFVELRQARKIERG